MRVCVKTLLDRIRPFPGAAGFTLRVSFEAGLVRPSSSAAVFTLGISVQVELVRPSTCAADLALGICSSLELSLRAGIAIGAGFSAQKHFRRILHLEYPMPQRLI